MPQRTDLAGLLGAGAVRLGQRAPDRDSAIRLVGDLVSTGAVESGYVKAMLERERSVSTFLGEGIAVPHATFAATGDVHRDALVVVTFPEGVDWGGDEARVAIGLAAVGRGHIGILSRLAMVLLDPSAASALRDATDESAVRSVFASPRHE